jgi:hypothetical protein
VAQSGGSIPILSLTSPRLRCLQPRYLLLFLYEDGVVRANRLWCVGGAVRRHRTDVVRR